MPYTYDTLMMPQSGIIPLADMTSLPGNTAALCIGIGGAGIDALVKLKDRIRLQLRPDNPGNPDPRYDGFRMLGIDSDDTDDRTDSGHRRLSDSEFCCIRMPQPPLSDPLQTHELRSDPRLNWMDIDGISKSYSHCGAGGVRQLGRYMLMEHLSELFTTLVQQAQTLLHSRGTRRLDVAVFAGLSGGTGSGCYADVCYLLRQMAAWNGWDLVIHGYFFLPDVVLSRHSAAAEPQVTIFHESSGYAALKELDHLMRLESSGSWFEQNYGFCRIRTQEPPVDRCHLISATTPEMGLYRNGCDCALSLAADAFLTELLRTGGPGGRTAEYLVPFISQARLPREQFTMYLAAGFFRRFREKTRKDPPVVAPELVSRFLADNGLDASSIFRELTHGTPPLELIDLDRKLLASSPCFQRDQAPESWVSIGDCWLYECRGNRARSALALNRPLASYDHTGTDDDSLIGRLFRKLCGLAADPDHGPWYAAALLNHYSQDLQGALRREIAIANERMNALRLTLDSKLACKLECNQAMIDRRLPLFGKRAYIDFKHSVEDVIRTMDLLNACEETIQVLREFLSQVRDLHQNYFKPLCTMLDCLDETFRANEAYLETPEAAKPDHYTWQLPSLAYVKPRLDALLDTLSQEQLVSGFMSHLLAHPDQWLTGDSGRIALLVRDYMLQRFSPETNRSLEDYLCDLYRDQIPRSTVPALTAVIQNELLSGMQTHLPANPAQPLSGGGPGNWSGVLLVPGGSPCACAAANALAGQYQISQTAPFGLLRMLRVYRFPALHGQLVARMKERGYDRCPAPLRSGMHLYSPTGRGTDGSGHKDWSTLPELCP